LGSLTSRTSTLAAGGGGEQQFPGLLGEKKRKGERGDSSYLGAVKLEKYPPAVTYSSSCPKKEPLPFAEGGKKDRSRLRGGTFCQIHTPGAPGRKASRVPSGQKGGKKKSSSSLTQPRRHGGPELAASSRGKIENKKNRKGGTTCCKTSSYSYLLPADGEREEN